MAASSSIGNPYRNGFELWRKTIKACRYAVGPREHIPDLAFRLLCRHHNVQLFYTPLLKAEEILNDWDSYKYHFLNANNFQDRPLIVQLCSRDPNRMLQAAERVDSLCDAIDLTLHSETNAKTILNQAVGKDFQLLQRMISLLRDNLNMPVACKIKIAADKDSSSLIKYAKRLESAGCQLLSIGCRHKEPRFRLDDWNIVKAVKDSVVIPVFACSDISTLAEADLCLEYTGAQGIMSHDTELYYRQIKTIDDLRNLTSPLTSTMSGTKREKKRKQMKIKLTFKKQQEREKKKLKKLDQPLRETTDDYITKRQRHILRDGRLRTAMCSGQRIVIDMGLTEGMTNKEISKLCNQVGRLYGSNCIAEDPWHIYFTRFGQEDELYQRCTEFHHGFQNYKIDVTTESVLELFPPEEIVVMSPDSKNVLRKIDSSKVYVLGGIVDESIRKRISLHYGMQCEVATCRLPIPEYMMKAEKGTYNQVLSINQVFDILLHFAKTGDWVESLQVGIPQRKGWIPKATNNQS
ncbi:uncharacterized protein TRIADDRAFT_53129 [Trichoplax adhaerens]|uniref:tRNA methyltransferase 10 homolog B n=1 Tax=Trichoplax adhaerens TaxID=10228 RepID=B3RND8_TRIAD|nr:hypothetical protein TRIADDRAFT_53129 [Trichoplax adhaerens]EDV28004.1 hypothetical protein TRIADDRAFT_53129 [Trichoplax adhaerens]|eukprot:XP_002109838.1 hypothetical protein TRIADDRAFT_53129 [Trichoplax adhaerens]